MRNAAIQLDTLSPTVINYIRELEVFKSKYYELKEQYDVLMYKKYIRSAEKFLADDNQQQLFTEEAELPVLEESEESKTEKQEIKYNGNPPALPG